MMRNTLIAVTLALLVFAPAFAQTLPGTIGFDLQPGTPVFNGSAVVDADSDIDATRTVANGTTFKTLVRLNETENLMGVSFDFSYPTSLLTVVSRGIRETRSDVDFDSQQGFNELTGIVNWFAGAAGSGALVDTFEYTYNDGTGSITTQPGVVIDHDGDGAFGFNELTEWVNEFALNAGGQDVPFWTEVLAKNAARGDGGETFARTESVEVFDKAGSDVGGTTTFEDNTVVLLARPGDGRTAEGAIVPGYGFDSADFGSAILFEVTFRAQAVGNATIDISNAVGIDESFQDLSDVKDIANVQAATVTVN